MISLLGDGAVINNAKWFHDMLDDLNILQIFQGLRNVAGGYEIDDLYRMYPANEKMMEFRRMITRDMEQEEIRKLFEEYSRGMKLVRSLESNSKNANSDSQQMKFHCDALAVYFDTLDRLQAGLEQMRLSSRALQSVLKDIQEYLKEDRIMKYRSMVTDISNYFCDNTFTISIEKDSLKIVKSNTVSQTEGTVKQSLGGIKVNRLGDTKELMPIEKTLVQYLEKKEKGIWNKIRQLKNVKEDEQFYILERELQFYLCFFRYIVPFRQMGYDFCMPETGEEIEIREGYDFALAGKEISNSKKVIANSFRISGQERFVVVTGANGGGKTTYARMAGEVLFFSSMGLLVPAKSATLPFFRNIATHFSVEESEKTGKGKLLEELQRLQPLLKNVKENHFVILNELFTTAATKDALEMGRCVMDRMISKNMRGIYVTHIQGLAVETEHIVSMVAEMCDDHRTRSYKMSRRLPGAEEYEDSMIEKHHLLTHQIKEVLSHALR